MRILVFQHLCVEHPGTLADFWREAGHAITTVELDEGEAIPPLEDFDLLVVMGGPMDVWQEAELPWLIAGKGCGPPLRRRSRASLSRRLPGSSIARLEMGAPVGPMAAAEVEFVEVELTPEGRADPIFAGFSEPVETFQWHGAEVKSLPEGAVAAKNAAAPIQAMRYGRHAWGFQYHVEITACTVAGWRAIPSMPRASMRRWDRPPPAWSPRLRAGCGLSCGGAAIERQPVRRALTPVRRALRPAPERRTRARRPRRAKAAFAPSPGLVGCATTDAGACKPHFYARAVDRDQRDIAAIGLKPFPQCFKGFGDDAGAFAVAGGFCDTRVLAHENSCRNRRRASTRVAASNARAAPRPALSKRLREAALA